jgi:FAD synthase
MPASPTLIARTPLAAEQRGAVLAIGNFDGVHLGHQALIRAARVDALARGARAGVPHLHATPDGLLAPPGPAQLTTDARRVELLAAAGAEVIVLEPFTAALAALPATAFLDEVLVRDVGVSGVVVGPDFCFGHGRSGNVATLRDAGRAHGFSVTVVPAVEVDGAVVSSSRVRAALVAGDLARATTLLGRPWDVDAWWCTAPSAGVPSACRPPTWRPTARCRCRWASTRAGSRPAASAWPRWPASAPTPRSSRAAPRCSRST